MYLSAGRKKKFVGNATWLNSTHCNTHTHAVNICLVTFLEIKKHITPVYECTMAIFYITYNSIHYIVLWRRRKNIKNIPIYMRIDRQWIARALRVWSHKSELHSKVKWHIYTLYVFVYVKNLNISRATIQTALIFGNSLCYCRKM